MFDEEVMLNSYIAKKHTDTVEGVKRHLTAEEDLIHEIRKIRHVVNDEDPCYTCPAASLEIDGGEAMDPAHRGGDCTCGRDQWVVKMLKIVASFYSE